MKNSLIPKNHLVSGKKYWCVSNAYHTLRLMKYVGHDIFEGDDFSANSQKIRVMFEGYTSIGKSRIPKKYLVPGRHYWCRYNEENELLLMCYDKNSQFYSLSHDVFWDATNVKAIFEDYEH